MWLLKALCLTFVTMSVLRTIVILLKQAKSSIETILGLAWGAMFGYVIYLAVLGGRLLGN